jgi:DNA (cytosine-5)-methyltransferase 1
MLMFGSVCSGIEAASVAWERLGWTACWFAEVDRAASEVLAYRFPNVPNHGDMMLLAAMVRSRTIPAPDVLVGGTPCQAFSVAGLRLGLADERGQLTLAYVDLVNAIDEVRAADCLPPCIAIWENVPGVLSSKDNAFGCFLAGLAGEDCELRPAGKRWTNAGCVLGPERAIAWRIINAQYVGLAQRRRRVFVVAGAGAGFDPAAILLEFDGLRRDSAPRRGSGEGTTHPVAPSLTSSGRGVERVGGPRGQDPVVAVSGMDRGLPGVAYGRNNCSGPIDAAAALNAHGGPCGRLDFETETFIVQQPIPFDTTQITSPGNYSVPRAGDPCHPLAAGAHPPAIVVHGSQSPIVNFDLADALGRNSGQENAVAFQASQSGVRISHTAGTLDANYGPRRHNGVLAGMAVRRLMPVECERLQGFPDGWTLVPTGPKRKPAADGPRYKQLGNSMAVNVMRWIGQRVDAWVRLNWPSLGHSYFDYSDLLG